MRCLAKVLNQFFTICPVTCILLTEALEGQCVGYSGRRLAILDGLPDTPAADILDFWCLGGKVLDFVPLKYGHADLGTQVIYIKHFTEEDISGVAADVVRRSEWANDGYTLGQHGKVDEVSLRKLSKARGERRENLSKPTNVMTSLAR